MAGNPFDAFDGPAAASGNPFDAFDSTATQKKAAAAIDPTADMPWYERLAAGIGGGMVNLDNRVRAANADMQTNFFGRKEAAPALADANAALAAQTQQDAPLRATGAGGLGYTIPAAIATAPLAGGSIPALLAQGGAQAALMGDNPLAGAATSVVGGKTLGALGNLVTKAFNASRGAINPTVAALQQQAVDGGVPLAAGDIGYALAKGGDTQGGMGWNRLENWINHVPFSGREGVMVKQAQGTTGLADRIGSSLDVAAGTGGAMPQQAIASDLRDEFVKRSAQSSANYAAARNELAQAGMLQPVVLHDSQAPIAHLADQFESLVTNPNISKDSRAVLASITAPVNGQKLAVDPNQLDKVRSALMEVQRSGDLNQVQHGFVRRAIDGVNKDEATWANQLPAGSQAKATIDYARQYHRDMVAPYNNTPFLSDLLNPNNAGDSIMGALGKGKAQAAAQLASALGPDGKAALAAAHFQGMTASGVNDSLQAGVSPSRLVKALDIGNEVGQNQAATQIYDPQALAQIQQLSALADATRRSASWANQNDNGSKGLMAQIWSAAKGGAALPLMPIARGANALSTHPGFQRALYANTLSPQQLAALQAGGGMGGVSLLDLLGQ